MGDQNRGRIMVMAIVGTVIGLDILTTAVSSIILSGGSFARSAIRIVLTAALGWALWNGKTWAKWVLGILMLLGAAGGLIAGLVLGGMLGEFGGGLAMSVLFGMAIIHGVGGVLLLVSKDVQAYLDSHDTIVRY
jgi:hypothetical protein